MVQDEATQEIVSREYFQASLAVAFAPACKAYQSSKDLVLFWRKFHEHLQSANAFLPQRSRSAFVHAIVHGAIFLRSFQRYEDRFLFAVKTGHPVSHGDVPLIDVVCPNVSLMSFLSPNVPLFSQKVYSLIVHLVFTQERLDAFSLFPICYVQVRDFPMSPCPFISFPAIVNGCLKIPQKGVVAWSIPRRSQRPGAMDDWPDGNERLKALPHITVVHLQGTFQTGFNMLGHRNIQCLLPPLEGMTWNTAPTKHRSAFVLLESVLLPLLQVCHNGLVPAKLSLLALTALHKTERFTIPDGYTFEQAGGYFCQKLRQMAGKIRELVANASTWYTFAKRLSQQERQVMLRYCRCLDNAFERDADTQVRSAGLLFA